MATLLGANQTFHFFHRVMDDKHVKFPLILTILVHLFALGIGTLPPLLFDRNIILEEIYTVDLFDLDEPTFQPAPPPKVETPPEPAKPTPAEPVLSIAQQQPKPAGPVEIISLKPRKVKKKIQQEKPKLAQAEKQKINNALEKLKLQKEREAAEQRAKQAKASADAAAKNAVDLLRDAIRSSSSSTTTASTAASAAHQAGARRTGSRSVQIDAALKQYYISVVEKIHQHWILPEMQKWDENLVTYVVLYVRRDGIVTKKVFEKKSPNVFFNQFVEKTLRLSLPLPPFPPNIKDKDLEIGLNFRPGGLM
jgi:colicin import membrane protein